MSEHLQSNRIDEAAIRAYRAERIRGELRRQNHEAVLVMDPGQSSICNRIQEYASLDDA